MPPKAAPKAAPAKAAEAKAQAKPKPKPKPVKPEVEEEVADKVAEPDRKAFEEAQAKISEAIEKLQAEAKGYTAEIDSRSGGKDEYNTQRADLRCQLDEFSAKIDAMMNRKTEIQKAMGDKRQEGIEMRNQLNKMKKSVGYNNEADIDARIAEIEKLMVTTSMSLKEEKDYIKEISDLKKRRPQVSRVKNMEEGLNTRDSGADLKEQIGIINAEMSQYRDGKRLVQEKLKTLLDSRSSQVGDLSDIFAKRDAANASIKTKIAERNELRDEFRLKEKEYNNYLWEVRKKRQEKAAEERNARQAEWDKQKRVRAAEKLDEQPHISEITLIEQSISFCKSLITTKDVETKEEKKEIEHNNPEGTEILTKKEDREEFYFVPLAKKKSQSKSKGSEKKATGKAIKHNAVTFKLFDALKMEAPVSTDQVPATLEQLEQLLQEYKDKVKEWEKNRDDLKRKILEGEVEVDERPAEKTAEDGEKAATEE